MQLAALNFFLLLFTVSTELTAVRAQFGGGEACTPGTAPPPLLRPLDTNAG